MRIVLLLILAATSAFASSRPLIDHKYLVALDSRAGGFDAYWIHRDERKPEVTTRLLRTPISLDGRIAGPTILIREDAGYTASGVATGPAGPMVWRAAEDRVLRANDKVIAENVEQPNVLCGATLCAATWMVRGEYRAQFVDRDANLVGAPFTLPAAWYLYAKTMAGDDLLVVRAIGSEVRATRIGLGGAVRYDILLLAREPLSNQHPAVAISHDGARSVFAIVETPWMAMPLAPSQSVRAVAIDAQGVVEQLGSLLDVPGSNGLGPVALVWDGARHLLAGTYSPRAATNVAYVAPLDANYHATGRLEVTPTAFGAPTAAAANGDHIAISWGGFSPIVSVYTPAGMSAPVVLEEPARRRTAGR